MSYRRAEEIVADEDSFASKVSTKHQIHKINNKKNMLLFLCLHVSILIVGQIILICCDFLQSFIICLLYTSDAADE